MGDQCGPNVIAMVLKRNAGERQKVRSVGRRVGRRLGDDRSRSWRCFEDGGMGPQVKDFRRPLEAEKSRKPSLLQSLRKKPGVQTPDFSAMKVV